MAEGHHTPDSGDPGPLCQLSNLHRLDELINSIGVYERSISPAVDFKPSASKADVPRQAADFINARLQQLSSSGPKNYRSSIANHSYWMAEARHYRRMLQHCRCRVSTEDPRNSILAPQYWEVEAEHFLAIYWKTMASFTSTGEQHPPPQGDASLSEPISSRLRSKNTRSGGRR